VAADPEANPESVARSIVLRQLTNSPKSRLQLARKLAERNVPEEVAEAVLDRFEEVRLIDDADFAEMWVRSRSQSRKLARGALRRELADKGIDTETAEQALAQVSDDDERNAARDLVARRLRAGTDLSDRAERDKQTRRLASMLARKGYQPSTAFRIVGEVLDETLAQEPGSYGAGEYGGPEAHGPEAGGPEAEDIG
jgi:regulatory protein